MMRDVRPTFAADEGGSHRHVSSRREFLRIAGLGGAALLLPTLATACSENPIDPGASAGLDLSTDSGALNFAYALTQLQYQFYWNVRFRPYVGITSLEKATYTSLTNQHSGQRYMLLTALQAPIGPDMRFDFTQVDFSKRSDVAPFARSLEDLAVAAYNGLMFYAKSELALTTLAKMASIEARHSATLRDLGDIASGNANSEARVSFAQSDVVSTTTGGNMTMMPADALEGIRPYLITRVSLRGA